MEPIALGNKMANVNLDYLNEEREKAWKRIQDIEDNVKKLALDVKEALDLAKSKISEDEISVKTALVNATAYAETAKNKSQEIEKVFNEISPIIDEYKSNKTILNNAIKKADEISEKHELLLESANYITNEQNKIQNTQVQTNDALSNAQALEDQIKDLENSSSTSLTKIKDMLTKSSELKTEISDLYDEIFGYETENGEQEEGLKDKLAEAYKKLSEDMKKLSNDFVQLKNDKTSEFNQVISDAKSQHDAVVAEIRSHLPDGVAAGLAGAFHEKKETETKTMEENYKKFDNLLKWMVGVALLPFGVYLFWLFTGKTMDEVIRAIPNMTIAVLPLYAPLIWLGIHLNKKINLSKKLIEEYAYKEAISKTVTGVSEQLKTLQNEEASQEIYENLIRLIISASADNPGKYITEYNKCDNPFVEILSDPKKFEKLLEKTPGLADGLITFISRTKEVIYKNSDKAKDKVKEATNDLS